MTTPASPAILVPLTMREHTHTHTANARVAGEPTENANARSFDLRRNTTSFAACAPLARTLDSRARVSRLCSCDKPAAHPVAERTPIATHLTLALSFELFDARSQRCHSFSVCSRNSLLSLTRHLFFPSNVRNIFSAPARVSHA